MPSQVDLTLGAAEIGTLVGCMLYGAVTVQLYTYSRRCNNDPSWLILLTVVIWVLETFLTVVNICWFYNSTISSFGNPLEIMATPWTLSICITLQGVIGAIVQSFFAYRVWKVSNKLIWPSLAWAGSTAQIAFNISMSYLISNTGNIITFSENYSWEVITSLIVALTIDIITLVTMTWYLSKMRSEYKRTLHMVNQIMIYSIETGLITSITAVCILVTRFVMPNNFVWIGLVLIYSRLYSNSFMVSLNARSEFQGKYYNEVNIKSPVLNGHLSNPQRLAEEGINVQMVTFTETGDPGQKRGHERENLDSIHAALSTPYVRLSISKNCRHSKVLSSPM